MRPLPLVLLVVACLATAADGDALPDPPDIAAILAYARPDTWEQGTVVVDPGTELSGGLRAGDGGVRFKPASGDERLLSLAQVRELRYRAPDGAGVGAADALWRSGKYAEAAAAYATALKAAPEEPYLRWRHDEAQRRQQVLSETGKRIPVAIAGQLHRRLLDDALRWAGASDARSLPPDWRAPVNAAWEAEVGLATPEDRARWQTGFQKLGVRLTWDEQAPKHLAAALEAAHGDSAEAARTALPLFQKALAAHAGFSEEAWYWFGRCLFLAGQKDKAGAALLHLGKEWREKPEAAELMVKVGVSAPPLQVQLLNLSLIGGKGDQWLTQVEFAADGSIVASSPDRTMSVTFAADGGGCRGITGNVDAASTGGGRNYAVKLTRTNPFDHASWQVGYNQVHAILQQPYLVSPAGWTWWKWTHADCKPRELMADSRAIDVFFPTPDRFIVWCWRDGGNSSITRDPRDLDQKNTWVHRGGGSCSYFMLGDARSGAPLGGVAYGGRPGDACVDRFGRLFVGDDFENDERLLPGLAGDGCGFSICDGTLAPLAQGRFGRGRVYGMAVRDRILVVVGAAGSAASTDRKGNQRPAVDAASWTPLLKNPAQPKPGGGIDGFIAILSLW